MTATVNPAPAKPNLVDPDHRPPTSAQVIRLVAAREILAKLRDKAFLISTAVLLLIVVASVVVPIVLERGQDQPKFTLATVGAPAQAAAELAAEAGAEAIRQADADAQEQEDAASAGESQAVVSTGESPVPTVTLSLRPASDPAVVQDWLRAETVDAALVTGDDGTVELLGLTEVDSKLSQLVALAIQSQNLTAALQSAGVSETDAQRLRTAAPLTERLLDPPPANAELSLLLGVAFAFLFFMTTFTFGLSIAQSVVEEKQSRVIELLVAAVPVRLLLVGKVVGTGLLALGQVLILLAVGLAGASVAGQSAAVSLLLHTGGWFLAFFVLGFGMLACVWAAAGALSARQEDLQATTAPLQILIGLPFFASVYITEAGPWLTALSYFPFSAPLSMPRRLLMDDAAIWEPVVAAGGVALTGAVLVALATRLYEGGLLRTSGRTSVRSAWLGHRSQPTETAAEFDHSA